VNFKYSPVDYTIMDQEKLDTAVLMKSSL